MGSRIDRDGAFTCALTGVVVLVGCGLPWLAAMLVVLVVGLRAPNGPAQTTTLVVPGKRLDADLPDRDFEARLKTAARLAEARRGSQLVILGGRTGRALLTEAEAGERYLRAYLGGAPLRILLERSSRDTLTNLRNVRTLLGDAGSVQPVTLVSNRYHLARLGLTARSLGLDCRLVAAEPVRAALRIDWALNWPREGYFLAWFVTGKLWARLTSNRRMLERVT